MSQKVLVTGGAGFIGSHVVRAFQERGDSVTILDNLSSGKRANVPPDVRLIVEDIRSEDAATLVRDSGFDIICHLAAQIDVRKSVTDPMFDVAVNIGGSVNLLEAVRASGKHATRFVFSSTGGAIYGDLAPVPSPEDAPKDPQSPYGTAKLSVEYYMGYFARVHGLDTVALRYGNVYGPRQDAHGEAGVVAIFSERILEGRPLTIFGDGMQTRDYVYVGDVARANILAATRELPPVGSLDARAFNVGTGVETDVNDLARMLREVSGVDAKIQHAPARAGEVQRSALDVSKIGRALGWKPEMALHDGLAATFRWFAAEYAHTGTSQLA